jgi:hypothetical protein
MVDWIAIAAIGAGVGLLAGMFGKGGSAVATPLLYLAGVPAIVAVASPLPATIPSTLVAATAYWRRGFIDREVLTWSIAFGVPATIAGAVATHWIGGGVLVEATDVIVAGLGLRFLFGPSSPQEIVRRPSAYRTRLVAVALVVGVAGGLLANSGGFLLAPLYIAVLRLPIKEAFASSLSVAAALAVPGTLVHAALGHIDWSVVVVFAATSIPLSYLGARLSLRTNAARLERTYGAVLTVLGACFLAL